MRSEWKRTPEFVERVRELHAQGWTQAAIAAELRAGEQTVNRALKHGATVSSEHVSAIKRDLWRDRLFGGEDGEIWNRERIISAIRAWHKRTGRPPTYRQWKRPNGGGNPLHGVRRARRPTVTTVRRYFGTWNAAIEAAGFASRPNVGPPRVNGRCRHGHDVNIAGLTSHGQCRECRRLYNRERREGRDEGWNRRANGRCVKGHDLNAVGLSRWNQCKECLRLADQRYKAKRRQSPA